MELESMGMLKNADVHLSAIKVMPRREDTLICFERAVKEILCSNYRDLLYKWK